MSKILIIDDCYLCPYRTDNFICQHYKIKVQDKDLLDVAYSGKKINQPKGPVRFIPDWCPLDGAEPEAE